MNACTKWLDCFQFCRFLKLLGHVMVLLVVGLVAYMYYTVVLNIYGPMMLTGSSAQRAGASIVVILFSITVSGSGTCLPNELRRWLAAIGQTGRQGASALAALAGSGTAPWLEQSVAF